MLFALEKDPDNFRWYTGSGIVVCGPCVQENGHSLIHTCHTALTCLQDLIPHHTAHQNLDALYYILYYIVHCIRTCVVW